MHIPIQNIYYLLSYAWNMLEESRIVRVKGIRCDTLPDLFAKVLANGMSYILRRGVDRGYTPYCGTTAALRGKIDFNTTLKRTQFPSPHLVCEYDELSYNVLHNQVVKATLAKLMHVDNLNPAIRDELVRIYRRLQEVDEIALEKQHFRRIQLHSNNSFYRFLLNICELIHENLFISEEDGTNKFRDFVRDEKKMAALFEAFVRNFYKREQATFRVSREMIVWVATPLNPHSQHYLPKMQTDITLTSQDRKIIIDTKYYTRALQTYYDKDSIHSANLYQLHAYLTNLESLGGINTCCEGILLYPTVQEELDLHYEMKGHQVRVKTINLNQHWEQIHRDLFTVIA